MPRKILIGFGVDVDAVAGWYVYILRRHACSTVQDHTDRRNVGWARTEAKILRLTSPE